MADSIITLTTDFGTSSPFVAAMKGVILDIHPTARLVDLSHDIPPQDLRHAAFFLCESLLYFPPSSIHVVVVDPEVGTARSVLHVAVAQHHLLVPDNGLWTPLLTRHPGPIEVRRLTEPRFWRSSISSTFHGRDIFAPVAAHLSRGVAPADLGPITTQWRHLDWPAPRRQVDAIDGEVIFVDHFGNLITNIPESSLPRPLTQLRIQVAGVEPRPVRTYAEAEVGDLVALVSSSGLVEIAQVQGNAARRLQSGIGLAVRVEWTA